MPEYTFTRFKVHQEMYKLLKHNSHQNLTITVNPKKGNHPRGVYKIPNNDAVAFIESKIYIDKERDILTPNWSKYENFHQDSIPKQLIDFFESNQLQEDEKTIKESKSENNLINSSEKTKKTILSKTLLNRSLEYYNSNKAKGFIVSPSLPILFFGDIESYNNSDFKVVTVGLNPSNAEFRLNKTDKYSYERFPDFNNDYSSLEKSLCNYFKIKPYRRWFNSYEPFLNELGCSYYPENNLNKVLHTDICSPLATEPTWSKLSKEEQDYLIKDGFKLWNETIEELQPDLIIISTGFKYLKMLLNSDNPREIGTLYSIENNKDGTPRKKPFKLKLFKRYYTYIVYGEPRNTPFGSVSTIEKIKMGNATLRCFNKISPFWHYDSSGISESLVIQKYDDLLELLINRMPSEAEEGLYLGGGGRFNSSETNSNSTFIKGLTERNNFIKKMNFDSEKPLSESELYLVLFYWFKISLQENICDFSIYESFTPIIYINPKNIPIYFNGIKLNKAFSLNIRLEVIIDTNRNGVRDFLKNIGNPWHIISNQPIHYPTFRGNRKKEINDQLRNREPFGSGIERFKDGINRNNWITNDINKKPIKGFYMLQYPKIVTKK